MPSSGQKKQVNTPSTHGTAALGDLSFGEDEGTLEQNIKEYVECHMDQPYDRDDFLASLTSAHMPFTTEEELKTGLGEVVAALAKKEPSKSSPFVISYLEQRDERRRNLGHKKASTASGTPEQQHQEASQAPGEGAGKDGVAEGVQRGHLAEGAGVGGAGPVVVDMEVDMEVGEPKRQAVDGAVDPPGKKPRPAAELVPSVEVKAERADPYLAMQPTTEERSSVAAIIQATGLRAVEALTALRASENDVRVAIKLLMKAVRMQPAEVKALDTVSITSEAEKDEQRAARRRELEELQHGGNVLLSSHFMTSIILNATSGSQAVRLFLRKHSAEPAAVAADGLDLLALAASSSSSSGSTASASQGPPLDQRRLSILRLLTWEGSALKSYKHQARPYIQQLVQRLDERLLASGGPVVAEGEGWGTMWEDLLPLELLSHEAGRLEGYMTSYPEGNVGGVPAAFLDAQGGAKTLGEDGLELVETAGGEGKEGGGGAAAAPECIEILDDD